jgi:hypothetical protein
MVFKTVQFRNSCSSNTLVTCYFHISGLRLVWSRGTFSFLDCDHLGRVHLHPRLSWFYPSPLPHVTSSHSASMTAEDGLSELSDTLLQYECAFASNLSVTIFWIYVGSKSPNSTFLHSLSLATKVWQILFPAQESVTCFFNSCLLNRFNLAQTMDVCRF